MSRRAATPRAAPEAVAAYKEILRAVLDARPSGTRQRLATALGKNRSFVTQIANPAYPTAIPAGHIETIFEICHFSPKEQAAFQVAYDDAHPGRLRLVHRNAHLRTITVAVPDLGDPARNRVIDAMFADLARKLRELKGGGG